MTFCRSWYCLKDSCFWLESTLVVFTCLYLASRMCVVWLSRISCSKISSIIHKHSILLRSINIFVSKSSFGSLSGIYGSQIGRHHYNWLWNQTQRLYFINNFVKCISVWVSIVLLLNSGKGNWLRIALFDNVLLPVFEVEMWNIWKALVLAVKCRLMNQNLGKTRVKQDLDGFSRGLSTNGFTHDNWANSCLIILVKD